jgi:hypothetical protein
MQYPIYKLLKNDDLKLWDGPSLTKEQAVTMLKMRQKDNPKEKFFIIKMKESNYGVRQT